MKHKRCKVCKRFNNRIYTQNICDNCWKKNQRKTNLKFWLNDRYNHILRRVTSETESGGFYYGLDICSKKEFLDRFINDFQMKKIFKSWIKSNYDPRLIPSIDRIDSRDGYILGNMQALPHYLNCSRKCTRIKVSAYDLKMNLKSIHDSISDAARYYKINTSSIWMVVYGKRKKTSGLIFKMGHPNPRL